jgi:acyl transferase domain-containing protein
MARDRPLGFLYSSRPSGFEFRFDHVATLLRERSEFGNSLRACDAVIKARLGWSLEAGVLGHTRESEFRISEERTEPTLTAIQVALTDLLRSMGIVPSAALAISGGEWAAGYAMGALERSEAMELSCAFARTLEVDHSDAGSMFLLHIPASETVALLKEAPCVACLSCDLDPGSSLVSATKENIKPLLSYLQDRSIVAHSLAWGPSAPFHCRLAIRWAADLGRFGEQLGVRRTATRLYSSIAGGRIETLPAHHWRRAVDDVAYFRTAATAMIEDGFDTIVNVNVMNNLAAPLARIAAAAGRTVDIRPALLDGPVLPHLERLRTTVSRSTRS